MESVKDQMDDKAFNIDETNFIKTFINDEINYGLFTNKDFKQGDVLLEYCGEQISRQEMSQREKIYGDRKEGCFIFDGLKDPHGKAICIDATETDGKGKWANDSPKEFANCKVVRISLNNKDVRLFFKAIKDIKKGTEIR